MIRLYRWRAIIGRMDALIRLVSFSENARCHGEASCFHRIGLKIEHTLQHSLCLEGGLLPDSISGVVRWARWNRPGWRSPTHTLDPNRRLAFKYHSFFAQLGCSALLDARNRSPIIVASTRCKRARTIHYFSPLPFLQLTFILSSRRVLIDSPSDLCNEHHIRQFILTAILHFFPYYSLLSV